MKLFGQTVGGPKPSFGITLDGGGVCMSGSTLTGRVWADIPEELKGTRMSVDFYGKEETKVRYETTDSYTDANGNSQTRTHTHYAYGHRDIFRISMPVAQVLSFTQTGKINPGQYVMPFEVMLPAFLPSSMNYDSHGGYARVHYKVKMALKGSGMFWDYTAETSVRIQSATISRYVPFDGPPDEQNVTSCCCFGRGSISVGASVDNTSLSKGQQALVSYACRNNSRNDVDDICAELTENIYWSASGHHDTEKRTLHTVRFPIGKDALKGLSDKEMQKKDSDNYQYAGMVHELYSKMNSATIVLPMQAHNTYRGSLIEISHKLKLKVTTGGCCTSNPEIVIPINACDVMMKPTEQPLAAAPAVAVPFSMDSVDVITTEPVVCTSTDDGYAVYGGTAQTAGKEGEGDDIPIAEAVPVSSEPPPSLRLLLSKMNEAGIGDRDVVMNVYANKPSWDGFFANLSPNDYAAIIGQTSSSFDESDVAVFLASEKMKGTFTCDHVAMAARKTEVWNRTNLIEKLIPYCNDFKQNKGNILKVLDEWDRCKAEVGFQEYLNSMADTKKPKKYIPDPNNKGAVKLNPEYTRWMKANGN